MPRVGRHLSQHLRLLACAGQKLSGWICGSGGEQLKSQKYADIIAGVDFVPFAVETSGVWGEQAVSLVKEIGRRICTVTHEPRSTSYLRQRIAVAVQRGNAFCILGTLTK
ncbi:MAG TPA: hypothetical protein VLS45_05305 [Methylomicrobium sp.]|nr:hypothetical protein [Methylomicrobium sp.]